MMRNPPMLGFLAAVQTHSETAATLLSISGLDVLELQIATVTALEAGYVAPTGKIHPSLTLTAEGRAWAAAELKPFTRLFRATEAPTKAGAFIRRVA